MAGQKIYFFMVICMWYLFQSLKQIHSLINEEFNMQDCAYWWTDNVQTNRETSWNLYTPFTTSLYWSTITWTSDEYTDQQTNNGEVTKDK